VRERLPGGVHQMRKAARRLRDGLATARPFLDRPEVQELRDELKWLSHELGVARDAEVQEARLQRSLEEVGHPADTSVSSLERSSVVAQRTVRDALGTDRYLLLLSRLDELVASPTWSGKAASSIAAAYLPRVARDWKRLAKRVATARDADDPGDRSDALHECRKAAKRFRYAVEPLVPVVGKPARRSVDDAKALQSLLGEHHDAVVGRRTARELAADAPADEAFALGAVVERERARLASLEASFRDVWGAAKGRKRHRWYG
jgi:CHAD domain-containing protein